VLTLIGPDAVFVGAVVEMLVLVLEDAAMLVRLNCSRFFSAVVSKFVPVIETPVPATPIDGVNDVILGAVAAVTVKAVALVAEPPGAVTAIVPVVAPLGTVTVNCVVVAADTVAPVP
jgi:hypothetical protein